MPQILTAEILEQFRSGITTRQARFLGTTNGKGWKKRITGRKLSDDDFLKFLSLARVKKAKGPAVTAPKIRKEKKPKPVKRVDYHAYLKSEAWRDRSKLCVAMAGYQCEVCAGNASGLQAHHYNYHNLGSEKRIDLFCLCGDCHRDYHLVRPSSLLPDDKTVPRNARLFHLEMTIRRYRAEPTIAL